MVCGAKVVVTGDGFVPGERSVIIMNHRTRMDWMFLWNCLLRYSYLRLEKICLKSSLKSIPGFGWAMQVAAFIFIQRKWEDDKNHFEKMLDYFCDIREPLQLLIFPEGTDLTGTLKSYATSVCTRHGIKITSMWCYFFFCIRNILKMVRKKDGIFFTKRVVKHWHRLPREAVDAPSLEVSKARLDGALNNLV
ncbi:hypothetical protein DUI87_09824 [Hirundo rustica rustica]|uniref:Phospholipid/glycerol acyltransferase domain-containing protein n=1 Tax=Hirundo rustica rustica TaxID=333673 RepID=A0A3M0KI58_HIRRU|nr:hypothetical protein DUI87_09824 [Hirundo rustica rustica]